MGATVFRSDIAQATGLAQSVTVSNPSAQAVPVREQNLDGGGNLKVHEQGTVNVQSAGEEVSLTKSFSFAATNPFCGGDLYTVPADKTFIVEYIASQASFASTSAINGAVLGVRSGTDADNLPLLFSPQVTGTAGSTLVTTLTFTASPDNSGGHCSVVNVALGGQLQLGT